MQINELAESVEIAMKYNLPAIVVHPNLSNEALLMKGKYRAKFKIITPIDSPKGEHFGVVKFRGISTDTIETDGFEICLTPNKSSGDTRNEAKALTEFVRRYMDATTEIRFVLCASMREEDNITSMLEGLKEIRTPSFVRTDIQLKLPLNKVNHETHNAMIAKINSIVRMPIKLSGNIANMQAVAQCNEANRFAVNLLQAKTIIKEFTQQPAELRGILTSGN